MRLYLTELYKLYHKKTFLIGSVLTVFIILIYFLMMVADQMTTVDGVTYHGYDAVRMDRQITEAYRGELTDEKVRRIVEEYGLPSKVEDNYGWWRDANYLNGVVTSYFSDGYIMDWDNYQIPTRVYAIAETEWGELQEVSGEAILFAYTKGWQILFDALQMGMTLASVLVIIGISVVYAQESQTGMLPLLFTAQEGKEKDTKVKIMAAFTLTIIVYSVVVLSALALCGCVFGLDGGSCPLSVAMGDYIWVNKTTANMPVQTFAWVVAGFDFLAMMLLCAITMCVSAHCRSTFSAVTTAAAMWAMPLLIEMLFRGLPYFFATCMPLALVLTNEAYEKVVWGRTLPTVLLVLALFVICVEEGYRVYKRKD